VAGLRFESLADMPEGMRRLAADKLVTDISKTKPVAGGSPSAPKYHNIKTEVNCIKFDSKKEARRYQQLMKAQELGLIQDLRLQVDFTIQEAYTTVEGTRVQAIRYRADFTYKVVSAGYGFEAEVGFEDIEYWRSLYPGDTVIEDVKSKGTRTKEYQIKRKLMADRGHEIREV
jgi:hypothetical protein